MKSSSSDLREWSQYWNLLSYHRLQTGLRLPMLASPPAANNYTSSQLAPTLDHGTKGVLLAAKSFLPNSPQIKGICFNGWHMALKQMRDRLNCQVKKPVLLTFADLGSVLTVFFACRPDQAQDGDVIDNAIQCDLDRQPATDSGGKKKARSKNLESNLSPPLICSGLACFTGLERAPIRLGCQRRSAERSLTLWRTVSFRL